MFVLNRLQWLYSAGLFYKELYADPKILYFSEAIGAKTQRIALS